jgi:anti-sigma factor RsiW
MTARLPGEYTCREIVEAVTDYLEGRLPLPERTLFEQHLVICTGCKTYLEQMRKTIRVAGNVREGALSPRQQDDLVKLFRDWKDKK